MPNILLWSILCKTVGLPSSTVESERTARRQFHSPTLRCFRGRLCAVAAGRWPLKQSRWPESNWTLPLRSVGVAPSLGRFWLVFTALKLRYVLRRHIILSDSDGNQGVLDCFTVYVLHCYVLWRVVARLLPDTQTIPLRPTEPFVIKLYVCICNLSLVFWIRTTSIESVKSSVFLICFLI